LSSGGLCAGNWALSLAGMKTLKMSIKNHKANQMVGFIFIQRSSAQEVT